MKVFGNSNSLPISLVISLSQTLKGLHWDKIPGDNDDEVAARGILYLLIFQQLGQLVRWSWGYHVLLAPPEKYIDDEASAAEEEGRYRDDDPLIPHLEDQGRRRLTSSGSDAGASTSSTFESGGRTPVTHSQYIARSDDEDEENPKQPSGAPGILPTPANGNVFPNDRSNGNITSFPHIGTPTEQEEENIPSGIKGIVPTIKFQIKKATFAVSYRVKRISQKTFHALPKGLQGALAKTGRGLAKFFAGVWEFMNPPLWAMLIAVIVASIPDLQRLFFEEGSFIANSVTRAVGQSGGVAVPLILVVLGANLARNTLPKEALVADSEENQIGTKLLVASLISRMLLPTIIMAPMLALAAKFVPVSILDDPIFVIVCFLLTGAPSALQLAQICQINGVYEGVMSKLLFQSYVIW